MLRKQLCGIGVPGFPEVAPVKLTAYADDVTVIIKSTDDVTKLISCLNKFQKATSSRINWDKCASLLLGEWEDIGPPHLPQQCNGLRMD